MSASTFSAKNVVEIDGQRYTLLRCVSDNLWQLEEVKTLRITEHTLSELLQRYARRELMFVREGISERNVKKMNKTVSQIPEAEMHDARIIRSYVRAVIERPNTQSAMEPAIWAVWERLKEPEKIPSWTAVYRWKRDYLNANRDIRALTKDKGERGKWERFPSDLINIVQDAIEKIWLTTQRRTIQDTLDHALVEVKKENALRPSCMALPQPTRRLIKRQIMQITEFDRCAARYGVQMARRKFRSVRGHCSTAAPLERVEIDSTPMDLFVLDDDTGLPLGRPTLTVCIDDYSRCILGIDIAFDPPSYVTVSRCLRQAFTPKVSLRSEFPAIKHDWTAFGLMRVLVVDNGMEYHSDALDRACDSLGIEIHYAPRKTPWYKGKIERFLGTFNAAVAHTAPGTTFSNIVDRVDYDPAKNAIVRLSTLQLVARKWIVDVYHQKIHRSLQAPPVAVWSNSIRLEDIPLPPSLAELDAIMGRRVSRVLTHKGIEHDGLFYNSAELTDLRRRLGDKIDVEVSVDDCDLGSISVFDPKDEGRFYPAKALVFNYATGLTRWQHKVIKRYASENMRRYDPKAWHGAKEEIRSLIEEEYTIHKKAGARKKRFMTKGGKQHHKPNNHTEVQTPPEITVTKSQKLNSPQVPSIRPQFTPVMRNRPPH